jgi:hypothetical protein
VKALDAGVFRQPPPRALLVQRVLLVAARKKALKAKAEAERALKEATKALKATGIKEKP